MAKKSNGATLGFESTLWAATEYKPVVLGLIFLKHISKLRVMVKRILRKYGYPPDLELKATQTVLEQAELIARDWAG